MKVEPYPGTNKDIERITGEFRERILGGISVNNGTFVRTLVERTGGAITVADDPTVQEAQGGSLIIRGEQDYTIFLSPYTFPLRDNFTIAHELGHYVLHFFPRRSQLQSQLPLWFTRYGTGVVEWQANRFAAALLMPAEPFKKQFHELKGQIPLLSGMLSVSKDAVEVRAKSLQLLRE